MLQKKINEYKIQKKQNKLLNDENEKLQNELNELKDKFKDWKGENSTTKEFKKRRYDILYKLNKGIQSNVKEGTLDKFNIRRDSETGKYY